MLTIDKIKTLEIPFNSTRKNNFGPATQGLALYNDSVNLYKAISLVLSNYVASSTTAVFAQNAVGSIMTDTASVNFTYNTVTPSITADVIPGGINHNNLLNYVANEHINHATVSILAGAGLTGGGDLTSSRTLNLSDLIVAETKGSASEIPVITANSQGRITGWVNTPISIDTSAITNLTETIQDSVSSLLVAGTGITLNYVDGPATGGGGSITISSSATGNVTSVGAVAPASGFTITNTPITSSGSFVFTLTDDLLALENLNTAGFGVRTATSAWATRSLLANTGNITITNANGVTGNPTFDLTSTGVVSSIYGSATSVPSLTIDGYGRIQAATELLIQLPTSQITQFNENVQDIISTTLEAGSGILLNYNDAANKLTIINTGTSSSDGNGIYTGSGLVPASTVATLTSSFAISSTNLSSSFLVNIGDTNTGGLVISPSTARLEYLATGTSNLIIAEDAGIRLTTNAGKRVTVTGTDARYAADYSASFSARSLVDKGYVDALLSTGLPSGTAGNILIHNGTNYVSATSIQELRTGLSGTVITLSNSPLTYAPFDIYRNGLRLVLDDDYTITGNQITFVVGFIAADKFLLKYYII
jgi:hypothetical protein